MAYPGITADSRKIKKGWVFVALKGDTYNGETFIQDAINNGAVAVITTNSRLVLPPAIALIIVKNAHLAFSQYAKQIYPNQPQRIVAVTGTNGKTSVANFYKQFTELLGYKSAAIGTLGVTSNHYRIGDSEETLTSPFPDALHRHLHNMQLSGITDVAIEASSHGLKQHRLDSVEFKAIAFTNLTLDHLDYHKTIKNYLAAKLRLFKELKSPTAVINTDDKYSNYFLEAAKASGKKIITYGKNSDDLKILSINQELAKLEIFRTIYEFKLKARGEFQVYNILCALGLAILANHDVTKLITCIEQLTAAPGRLEEIAKNIFIDYAHTPDALENALKSLKATCKGKLIVVFGCGGNRDASKRKLMGDIANQLADTVIITDDNPREEDAASIRREVIGNHSNFIEIAGRLEATKYALSIIEKDDILIIAGKGHENYQIIGKVKAYFSDKDNVINILEL